MMLYYALATSAIDPVEAFMIEHSSGPHQGQPVLHAGAPLERAKAAMIMVHGRGAPAERTMLLGFSQGACLAAEFSARHARRYGGVIALSGGLIGPDGTPRDYAGSFDGTPVFMGCSDVDPHIPKERVLDSAEVLRGLGGAVDVRLYPGMGHIVNQDEIDAVRAIMAKLV